MIQSFAEVLKITQLEEGMSGSISSLSSFHPIQSDLVYPLYSMEESPWLQSVDGLCF